MDQELLAHKFEDAINRGLVDKVADILAQTEGKLPTYMPQFSSKQNMTNDLKRKLRNLLLSKNRYDTLESVLIAGEDVKLDEVNFTDKITKQLVDLFCSYNISFNEIWLGKCSSDLLMYALDNGAKFKNLGKRRREKLWRDVISLGMTDVGDALVRCGQGIPQKFDFLRVPDMATFDWLVEQGAPLNYIDVESDRAVLFKAAAMGIMPARYFHCELEKGLSVLEKRGDIELLQAYSRVRELGKSNKEELLFSQKSEKAASIAVDEISDGSFLLADVQDQDDLIIPDGVRRISPEAFFLPRGRRKIIRRIVLPKSLEFIGKNAFSGLMVQSVVIPRGVVTIESGAFYGAKSVSVFSSEAAVQGDRAPIDGRQLSLGTLSREGVFPFGYANYEVEVLDSDSEDTLLRIWMPFDAFRKGAAKGRCHGWRKELEPLWAPYGVSFDFVKFDQMFFSDCYQPLLSRDAKVRIAQNRLAYPINLCLQHEKEYRKIVKMAADKVSSGALSP